VFDSTKRWSLGIAVTLMATLNVAAGWGYLPVAGPAPLRFQAPSRPKASLKPLPPLAVTEPAGTASDTESADGVGAKAQTGSSSAAANTSAPTPPDTQADAPASAMGAAANATASQEGLLTPQMLVKYFLSGPTNAPANSVFIPLGFRPPQPGTPPSSQATYSRSP
jgi:hypothetical protein